MGLKGNFQETPNTDLANALYELGQKAIKEFEEPLFGEFLITQSYLYRSGRFQEEYENVISGLEEMERQEEEEGLDDLMQVIDFKKQTLN